MTIRVRYAETEADKEAAYRLRYQVYVEDVGTQLEHSDGRMTDASDDRARILVAVDGDEVVGTLRINWGDDAPFGSKVEEIYQLSRFSSVVSDNQVVVFDRFVIKAEYRGTHVAFQLLTAITMFSLEKNVQLAFCDCQPHLLNLYLSLGFQTYTTTFNYPGVGIVVPLVLVCEDLEHLRQVGSPLLAFEQGHSFDSAVPTRVRPIIAQSKVSIRSATEESTAQWVEAYGLLSKTGTDRVTMFDGLSKEDVTKLLTRSHIIDCKIGDKIIFAGKSDRTIFVILEGTVEIRAGNQITTIRSKGDVVGELGFLLHSSRVADVVAATDDVRVLSLREKTLRQLQESEPAIAAQLMHNLARIVALKMVSLYQRTFS